MLYSRRTVCVFITLHFGIITQSHVQRDSKQAITYALKVLSPCIMVNTTETLTFLKLPSFYRATLNAGRSRREKDFPLKIVNCEL